MSDKLRKDFLKDVKKNPNKAAEVFIQKTKSELRKDLEKDMVRKVRRERFTTKAKKEARASEGNIQRARKVKKPFKFKAGAQKGQNPEKTRPQLYKRAQVVKRRVGHSVAISSMDKKELLRYIMKHDDPEMKSKFAGTHTRF